MFPCVVVSVISGDLYSCVSGDWVVSVDVVTDPPCADVVLEVVFNTPEGAVSVDVKVCNVADSVLAGVILVCVFAFEFNCRGVTVDSSEVVPLLVVDS